MINKRQILSIAAISAMAFTLTGCSLFSKAEPEVKVVYVPVRDKIQIPDSILESERTPSAPHQYDEKAVSGYILDLYLTATKNEFKIDMTKDIIERYNNIDDYNTSVNYIEVH